MRAAAKNLEFERAAALRDEVQQIRLRVLEEDASAEVAGPPSGPARDGAAAGARGFARDLDAAARPARPRAAAPPARGDDRHGPAATAEEPDETLAEADGDRRARPPTGCRGSATSTTTTAAGRLAGSTGRRGIGP